MIEWKANPENLKMISESIKNLITSPGPVVIRGGLQFQNEMLWKNFLEKDCGLNIDRRQYDFSETLTYADWWEISYQPEKSSSYAFSNTPQPFHTDNAWFSDPAEINFFIMKKQSSRGGDQLIYYLDRLLEDLASDEPGLLADLSQTEVVIKKGDGKYFNQTPIIVLSPEPKIFWNYYRTEKTSSEIASLCEAFFQYLKKKEGTKSIELLHCESGDCFAFNDLKMLHARTSFEASKAFDRILLQSMWSVSQKS